MTDLRSTQALPLRSITTQIGAVVIGSLILTLSSYVVVPMVPVPITLQTLAVTLVGALYGPRLGAVTVLAWLAQGAAGLPVLAGGAGGLPHFFGPTGGYLLSFPLVALLTGWLAERGWTGERTGLASLSFLLGNALCLVIGGLWLAVVIGPAAAFAHGVAPFLIGGILKSVVGACLLRVLSPRLKSL